MIMVIVVYRYTYVAAGCTWDLSSQCGTPMSGTTSSWHPALGLVEFLGVRVPSVVFGPGKTKDLEHCAVRITLPWFLMHGAEFVFVIHTVYAYTHTLYNKLFRVY